jgi:hypothetical protein
MRLPTLTFQVSVCGYGFTADLAREYRLLAKYENDCDCNDPGTFQAFCPSHGLSRKLRDRETRGVRPQSVASLLKYRFLCENLEFARDM